MIGGSVPSATPPSLLPGRLTAGTGTAATISGAMSTAEAPFYSLFFQNIATNPSPPVHIVEEWNNETASEEMGTYRPAHGWPLSMHASQDQQMRRAAFSRCILWIFFILDGIRRYKLEYYTCLHSIILTPDGFTSYYGE